MHQKTITYAIFGLVLGAIFGFIASQYFPFWSSNDVLGMIVEKYANPEPFSPYRLHYALGHVVLFGIIGAAVFAVIGFFSTLSTSGQTGEIRIQNQYRDLEGCKKIKCPGCGMAFHAQFSGPNLSWGKTTCPKCRQTIKDRDVVFSE